VASAPRELQSPISPAPTSVPGTPPVGLMDADDSVVTIEVDGVEDGESGVERSPQEPLAAAVASNTPYTVKVR